MAAGAPVSLALLVRSRPYENRTPRADIDLAMAAAAMDFELHVYFTGTALLQLARQRSSTDALLPAGYKAWSALPELAETRVYAEQAWLEYCSRSQLTLVMPVQGLDVSEMRIMWRFQQHVMVI